MISQQKEQKIEVQSLALPKGGGAIRGIGETFSPNEFSGTASLSIPLPVSPCRDSEPTLELQYSSGSGNSAFGLGYSLSTPAISRATNKGTPKYDNTDHFVMDSGNYLVPLDGKQREEIPTVDGLNIYAFINNNPVTFKDYNGRGQTGFEWGTRWSTKREKILV